MSRLEAQLGEIVEAADYDAWRQVPGMVVALYKKAAPAACRLAAWSDPAAGPEDQLWWHPDTRTAWAEVVDIEKRADWERLPDVPGVPDVALLVEPLPPPPVEGWVLVKAADGYLAPFARPGMAAQHALGGPGGLQAAIVNGLIGGGLGYGAGWVADQFLPEEHFQKGRMGRTLGIAGAGLGVGQGLWQWTAERRGAGQGALPGMTGSGPKAPGDTGAPVYPGYPLPPHKYRPGEPLRRVTIPAELPKVASLHPWLTKAAQGYGETGAVFMPTIPVADFNQTIWSDVRYPSGRYSGTGTPPYAAAATTGLLAGAAQAARSPVVSPWQVATAAAMGAGKGWLAGLAAGKVLGALAGLKPASQQKLQEAGLWGGLITGVADTLYR
jgi:hypothetical protein